MCQSETEAEGRGEEGRVEERKKVSLYRVTCAEGLELVYQKGIGHAMLERSYGMAARVRQDKGSVCIRSTVGRRGP